MRAMVFTGAGSPLREAELPGPEPGPGQVRLNVRSCAVCRTDLHIVDGELTDPKLPLVLGHQIVALVSGVGQGASRFSVGERVGVPWLGWTDGSCRFCRSERENLCDRARFTGYQIDGGFAEETVADERYCLRLPGSYSDLEVAPLLCAGLIGYRALTMTGDAERLGLYGFARPGDDEGQQFARSLGAEWAGSSTEGPPEELDAAIIFAPVGELVPAALAVVAKGGVVVCAGIHMSDIPSFSYDLLWGERVLRSVANLTRRDGEEFMRLAPQVPVRTQIREFRLEEANEALQHLRAGELHGAAVLKIG
jgi:alcohol dehydrogenase, propanol-preferring